MKKISEIHLVALGRWGSSVTGTEWNSLYSFCLGLLGTARIMVIIFQRTSLGNGVMGIYLVLLPLPVQTSLLKLIAEGVYNNFDDQTIYLSMTFL